MKALPMKLGQILSYVDEMVPAEHREIYRDVLGALQAGAQAAPWEQMAPVLAAELGGSPEEIFAAFDSHPIAAASIGQVYRATTRDGRDVAVKVQYPGVAEALDADLKNAESVVRAITAALPGSDLSHFIADIEGRLHEEVDYRCEARHQQAFAEAWAGDPDVVVPAVVPELSTQRVLVTEFAPGDRWEDMLALAGPEQKRRYGEVIYRFTLQSLYRDGMFNGDPHPGNYLFYPDGRVVFLDFGHVAIFDDEGRVAHSALRDALLSGVRGRALRPLFDAAFGMPEDLDDELWALFERYVLLTAEPLVSEQPYRFGPDYPRRLMAFTYDAKMTWFRKAMFRGVKDASRQGTIVAARINFGLPSILAQLGAEADWPVVIGAR